MRMRTVLRPMCCTAGSEIDARTRTPLWQNGWDYNHGTGHGIGYWLNVHEGSRQVSAMICRLFL